MEISKNICRTCLSSTVELLSIFDEIYVNSEPAEIFKMILLCTGLEISKYDEFPHYICYACTEAIVKSYEYRDKCWKSQIFLMAQYKANGMYDVKDEDEDVINNTIGDEIIKLGEFDDIQDIQDSHTEEIDDQDEVYQIEETNIDEPDLIENNSTIHEKNNLTSATPSKRPILPSRDEDILEYVIYANDDTCLYGKRYYCLMCDQMYVRPMTIRDHLIKSHKISLKKRDGFECKTCDKVFDRKESLVNHQKVHAPAKFVCDICGAVLKGKETLAEHKRIHTGEKPYKCQICDFRAAQKSSMEVHKRVHTGEKPYKCHICGLAFKTSSGRANHRRQHSEERPFECLVCAKSFKTRGVYKGHMKTHDSNQSIECDFCNKKFPPGRIKFHLRQHSPKPTYKCDMCGKTFFQSSSFQNHMENRHFKEKKLN